MPEPLRTLVIDAEVVFGGERHLDLLPPVDGQSASPGRARCATACPTCSSATPYREVVALATGDPLVSGIGTTLVELLGADRSGSSPAVSSVALARARMGWAAESTDVVSVVGRDPRAVLRHLAPGHRVLVLSSDGATPEELAGLLVDDRLRPLDADRARRPRQRAGVAAGRHRRGLVRPRAGPQRRRPWTWPAPIVRSWATGLPDEAFEHDGQLTKRDLRASALARLAPQPGELLWDVGAGAGIVGIEWMLTAPDLPVDRGRGRRGAGGPDRPQRRRGSAYPPLDVVTGRAPEALTSLPAPDAVFVGGGATVSGLVGYCLSALRPGGRLVVHGVTLETETLLARLYDMHARRAHPDLRRAGRAARLASRAGRRPARSSSGRT